MSWKEKLTDAWKHKHVQAIGSGTTCKPVPAPDVQRMDLAGLS